MKLLSWNRAIQLAVTALGLWAGAAVASEPDRPNFLIITSEDMSPDLGCYGDPNAITPNLDDLARGGNAYTSAFATGPICSPARTALLFGMHQTSLGAGNHRSRANTPAELLGFASYLREAGYFCTNAPKVDYNSTRAWEIERATYDRGTDWRSPDRGDRPFLSIINIAVSHQSYTSVLPFEQYRAEVRNKLPPSWIHDPSEMRVPPYFPDTPAVRKELARYADCVSLMDRRAGEILDKLAADGLRESTIVIYFSDHGAGHPRHKSTPYASGLRVPFIVSCPPRYEHLLRAPAGAMCTDVVSFVDIGPTLLHLAGVEIPSHMHGTPFLGQKFDPREFAFGALDRRAESFHLARTVTDGRYVYIRNYMPHIPFGQPKGYGFPSAIYQELARLAGSDALPNAAADYLHVQPVELLFDLQSDPFEVVNRAEDRAVVDVLDKMRAANTAHLHRIRDINFFPEEELARRAGTDAWIDVVAADMAQSVLEAAQTVGGGPSVIEQQLGYTAHHDPAVRWWGVLGLRQQQPNEAIDAELIRLLQDESAVVRIEAAAAAAALGIAEEQAQAVLLREIGGADPRSSHRAARAAQLLGLDSDEFIESVTQAARRHSTEWLAEVDRAMRRP